MQTTTVYQGLVYDLIYAEYIVHFALSKLHYPAFGLRQLLGRAAMVFDATVGGPTVGPCRSELPLLSDKTRFNAQWSTLAAKAPAQPNVSPSNAQTHRPSDSKRGLTCPRSERTS